MKEETWEAADWLKLWIIIFSFALALALIIGVTATIDAQHERDKARACVAAGKQWTVVHTDTDGSKLGCVR